MTPIQYRLCFVVGEYDWHPGLRKNSSGKRNYPALKCSTFIKTLCETFHNSSKERIDINEIILRTNLKLEKFIDNKMNWDLQDESWSAGPRLPMVTDQFCKKLMFPPDCSRPVSPDLKINQVDDLVDRELES